MVLDQLGENFPRKATKLKCAVGALETRRMLHGKSNDAILKLAQHVVYSVKLAVMQILNVMFLSERLCHGSVVRTINRHPDGQPFIALWTQAPFPRLRLQCMEYFLVVLMGTWISGTSTVSLLCIFLRSSIVPVPPSR
jgi:hypothetical protein